MSDSGLITYEAPTGPIVLVVEDEVLIRMAVADALREEGFVVIEATYPGEAISAVKGGLRPDILFTDIRLPGDMDGFGLAKVLQTELPELRVYIASGHGRSLTEATRLQNFIMKPYEPAEVAKRISIELLPEL